MRKVGHKGLKGSHSYLVAKAFTKEIKDVELLGDSSEVRLLENLEEGMLDSVVLPIENSIGGIVDKTYQILGNFNSKIVAEIKQKIEQRLLWVPDKSYSCSERLKSINKVFSHPIAFAQCKEFLEQNMDAELIECSDTATAAKIVKEMNCKKIAVLGSEALSEIYQLDMSSIIPKSDYENITRFALFSKEERKVTSCGKVSLILTLPHEAGSLSRLLSNVCRYGISLTNIKSQPLKEKPFEYLFYLDFEYTKEQSIYLPFILKRLRSLCGQMTVLGNYKTDTLSSKERL